MAVKKTDGVTPEALNAVHVRCAMPGKTFRRAGYAFDEAGQVIAKAGLSGKQLTALEAEPMLVVVHRALEQPASAVPSTDDPSAAEA